MLQVSSVDCSPSSSLRAVSSGTDRTIKVWDLNKGYCLRTIMCHSSCNSVRCTRDEHIICSGHFDGTLRFWDIRNGKMANEVTGLHTQQICSVQTGIRDGKTISAVKFPFKSCFVGQLVFSHGENLFRSLSVAQACRLLFVHVRNCASVHLSKCASAAS